MGNFLLNLLYLFLCLALLGILFLGYLIYYLPYQRIKFLEKRLKEAENLIVGFKKMDTEVYERIDNDVAKNPKFFEELKQQLEGRTIGEFLKTVPYLIISSDQDLILEVERLSSFEPRYWWPEKYKIKVQKMKERARSLLQEVREHEKNLNKQTKTS